MKIQQVSKNDKERIEEIARLAIIESVRVDSEIKQEIISDTLGHIEKGLSDPESVFLKCEDSLIRGFILVLGYWNLTDLYVAPESHGIGIGKELLLAATSACESRGRGFMRVNSSLNAEGFYRKYGFRDFSPKQPTPEFVVPLIYNF